MATVSELTTAAYKLKGIVPDVQGLRGLTASAPTALSIWSQEAMRLRSAESM
jgi:hypothetical protein